MEERTTQAIDRYATAWAASSRQTREVERYKAFRVAGAALLFFFVANFLYLRYGQTGSIMGASGILTDVLIEGLSIASWVVLWWPLDQLLHVGWQHHLDERAYHALKDITLAHPARSRSATLNSKTTLELTMGDDFQMQRHESISLSPCDPHHAHAATTMP